LPAAVAVVDPHRADCAYPFKELSRVVWSFKCSAALGSTDSAVAEMLEYNAEFVALGTVPMWCSGGKTA
jgi:single-stranded-DNA-specific exonuclease